jgi:hypothetical protein
MRLAVGTDAGAFDIGKGSGVLAAYAGKDLVEGQDLAGPNALTRTIRLSRSRFVDRGCAEKKETYQRRKIPHGPSF